MTGLGSALTAKYLLKPLFQLKALLMRRHSPGCLVVDVERRGHILDDLLRHRLGQKRFLFHNNTFLPLRPGAVPVCGSSHAPSAAVRFVTVQVLLGGGKGGDHGRQLAHHARCQGGSGFQRLQLLVELGQINGAGACHKDLVVLGARILSCSSSIISSS